MTPVMHDSEDWRGMQRSLQSLQNGQVSIQARMGILERIQNSNHHDNQEEISEMKLSLYGIPGDDENIGSVRKMDKLLAYGQATAFWAKVVAALVAILISLVALRH